MKSFFSYCLLISLIIMFSACNKEKVDPPIQQSLPVFAIQANLNGESLDMNAGDNGFYMITQAEIINGVKMFEGILKNDQVELKLGIFDGNLDIPGRNFIDFPSTDLNFVRSVVGAPLVELSIEQFPNRSLIEKIEWYKDGIHTGTNDLEIFQPGSYEICAAVTFTDGSQGNLCNNMIVGYKKNAQAEIRHILDQQGYFQAWIETQQEEISQLKWYLDGQQISSEEVLDLQLDEQFHLVSAEMTFQNGVVRRKSILVDGAAEGKYLDDFSVFESAPTLVQNDFNAKVSMFKGGKQYVSDQCNNELSTFSIEDISYYGTNSAGKPVYKMKVNVSCHVKNIGSGEIIPLQLSGTFGFEAYE